MILNRIIVNECSFIYQRTNPDVKKKIQCFLKYFLSGWTEWVFSIFKPADMFQRFLLFFR